jgi:hypothetical protein
MNEAADLIRKRMETARGNMADDMGEVVRSIKQMSDWREYVRRYPWACLVAAVAVGYLVVPRRVDLVQADADTLVELASKNKGRIEIQTGSQKRGGIRGILLATAAKTAVREVFSYLTRR